MEDSEYNKSVSHPPENASHHSGLDKVRLPVSTALTSQTLYQRKSERFSGVIYSFWFLFRAVVVKVRA